MEVDKTAIDEFIQIYKEEFGIELSFDEASIKTHSLLQLFDYVNQEKDCIVK